MSRTAKQEQAIRDRIRERTSGGDLPPVTDAQLDEIVSLLPADVPPSRLTARQYSAAIIPVVQNLTRYRG